MKYKHHQPQYAEFFSADLNAIKSFYNQVFGWQFTDYGPEYMAFEGDYFDVGFTIGTPAKGSILLIIYSANLEATRDSVLAANGQVIQEIFSFPGGRRFHFSDPDGNELAVWSDQ